MNLLNCSIPSSINAIKVIDAATPNASMSSNPNGSGLELEKLAHAPLPAIAVTAPADVPDAGLRSLDHCMYIVHFKSQCARVFLGIKSTATPLCISGRSRQKSAIAWAEGLYSKRIRLNPSFWHCHPYLFIINFVLHCTSTNF